MAAAVTGMARTTARGVVRVTRPVAVEGLGNVRVKFTSLARKEKLAELALEVIVGGPQGMIEAGCDEVDGIFNLGRDLGPPGPFVSDRSLWLEVEEGKSTRPGGECKSDDE